MPAQEEFVSPEEITKFRMPQPHVGQIVLWYPRGMVEERQARAAIVTSVRHASIAVWEVGAYGHQGVKHASDPRLRQNNEQRADGCWEFSETDLRLARVMEAVERIESQPADDSLSRESPARSSAMQSLWDLRKRCKEAGHTHWQTLAKHDAEHFLNQPASAR